MRRIIGISLITLAFVILLSLMLIAAYQDGVLGEVLLGIGIAALLIAMITGGVFLI